MRQLKWATLLLLLLIIPVITSGSELIPHQGITKIWTWGDGGERKFLCTGFYIEPQLGLAGAWFVSAGHCLSGQLAGRETTFSVIDWRAALMTRYTRLTLDVAIASLPDPRNVSDQFRFALAKKPESGKAGMVYGFYKGNEVAVPIVVGAEVEDLAGTWALYAPYSSLGPGNSGSPVVIGGQVVGIVWGGPTILGLPFQNPDGTMTVYFTPVTVLHELIGLMGGLQGASDGN